MIEFRGVGFHAAELVERESPVAGADARLAEEDQSARRFTLDEHGEHGDERRGQHQPGQGAGEIDRPLERAVEEFVDGSSSTPSTGTRPTVCRRSPETKI